MKKFFSTLCSFIGIRKKSKKSTAPQNTQQTSSDISLHANATSSKNFHDSHENGGCDVVLRYGGVRVGVTYNQNSGDGCRTAQPVCNYSDYMEVGDVDGVYRAGNAMRAKYKISDRSQLQFNDSCLQGFSAVLLRTSKTTEERAAFSSDSEYTTSEPRLLNRNGRKLVGNYGGNITSISFSRKRSSLNTSLPHSHEKLTHINKKQSSTPNEYCDFNDMQNTGTESTSPLDAVSQAGLEFRATQKISTIPTESPYEARENTQSSKLLSSVMHGEDNDCYTKKLKSASVKMFYDKKNIVKVPMTATFV